MQTPLPSKALPLLISLVSSIAGALVMYWSVSDRMEKQITEKVSLVAQVSQLKERIAGVQAEIAIIRSEMASLRNQSK